MDNAEFGLSENIINILNNFFANFPEIEEVKIYGSRAMGTSRRGSDIDFAVYGDCKNIVLELSRGLYNLPTPYKFDVTDYKTLKHQKLKEHIDRVGKTFYKKSK